MVKGIPRKLRLVWDRIDTPFTAPRSAAKHQFKLSCACSTAGSIIKEYSSTYYSNETIYIFFFIKENFKYVYAVGR